MAATEPVTIAVDNDVVLKVTCYGVASQVWGEPRLHSIGILGAAPYVIASYIRRADLSDGGESAQQRLLAFVDLVQIMEPSASEVEFAAELEVAAQLASLQFDAGESQLCAMLVERSIEWLETGDKRAIASLEALLEEVEGLGVIEHRVRCLEQVILQALGDGERFDGLAAAICGEPSVDKTLSICFSCFSQAVPDPPTVLAALGSYVAAIRQAAPTILAAGP